MAEMTPEREAEIREAVNDNWILSYVEALELLASHGALRARLAAVEQERDAERTRYVLADAGWKETARQLDTCSRGFDGLAKTLRELRALLRDDA